MTRLSVAVLLGFLFVLSVCLGTSANVILFGNDITLSFYDIEADFAPSIKGSGECGVLYLAEPPDACSDLTNQVEKVTRSSSPFALVIRGGCCFEEKVRKVQKAGFKAAIVYDNEDDGDMFAMDGDAAGIKIHAVFISKASGEILKKYAGRTDMKLCLLPTIENSTWSIMAIAFISLLAMSAALATCCFARRHRIRREHPRSSDVCEFHGMSKRLVKAMPSLTFTAVLEDNCTSGTCAICLEDYTVGEKLRILPCCHKFHAFCVDSWLTTWRTFCPVCKRDARTSTDDPPASESTPLLSSSPASVGSSVLSSVRSSMASSSAIHIAPASSGSPSVSRIHSLASTPYVQQSLRSYRQSPPIGVNRNSVDLRNASSQRSHASYLGYPSISPLNARYMSPYHPSPSNASASLLGSSSHQLHPLHYKWSEPAYIHQIMIGPCFTSLRLLPSIGFLLIRLVALLSPCP